MSISVGLQGGSSQTISSAASTPKNGMDSPFDTSTFKDDPYNYNLSGIQVHTIEKWYGGNHRVVLPRCIIEQSPTKSRTLSFAPTITNSTVGASDFSLTTQFVYGYNKRYQTYFTFPPDILYPLPGGTLDSYIMVTNWINPPTYNWGDVISAGGIYEGPEYIYQYSYDVLTIDLAAFASGARSHASGLGGTWSDYTVGGFVWTISVNGQKIKLASANYINFLGNVTDFTTDSRSNALNIAEILAALQNAYQSGGGTLVIDGKKLGVQVSQSSNGVSSISGGTVFSSPSNLAGGSVYTDTLTLDNQITVWLKPVTPSDPPIQLNGNSGGSEPSQPPQEDPDAGTNDEKNLGSGSGGDLVIPIPGIGTISNVFPVLRLEGEWDDTQGGGIAVVGDFWYNGEDNLYIESIDLSISGSSARIVESDYFDTTPKLNVGQRIVLYGPNGTPLFHGYVESLSKRINGSTQELVYSCNDWKKYINETPSHFNYRTFDRSIHQIASDMIIQTGAGISVNRLPNIRVDVDYTADEVGSILDYCCSIAGDYYWWFDKRGRIHLDHLNNGTSYSFAVPTAGTSLVPASHRIISFDCNTDLSLSKSKILVIGGSGFKGYKTVAYSGQIRRLNSSPGNIVASVDDMLSKKKSGIFHIKNGKNLYDAYTCWTLTDTEALSENPSTDAPLAATISTTIHSTIANYPTQYTNMNVSSRTWSDDNHTYAQFWVGPLPEQVTTETAPKVETVQVQKSSKDPVTGEPKTVTTTETKVTYPVNSISSVKAEIAYLHLKQPFYALYNTGYPGPVLTIKDSGFKYFSGIKDDTSKMYNMAQRLAYYHRPFINGTIEFHDLYENFELGDKITVTGTSLEASNSTNLPIWGIKYDFINRKTSVELSTRPSPNGLKIDSTIMKNTGSFYKEFVYHKPLYRNVTKRLPLSR